MRVSWLIFFGLFLLFSLLYIGNYGLIDWDEVIYAESARQMLLSGNYLNVYINGQPFAEKPPFFFWMMNLSYLIFGIGEFGARLPSVVAGAVIFTGLYFAGKRMISERFGILWAIISGFAFFPSILTRSAIIDQSFNLFIAFATLGFYFFDRQLIAKNTSNQWKILTATAILMGLGILTKGPLAGAIPVTVYGIYKFLNRQNLFSFLQVVYCGLLSLSVAGIWPLLNWLFYGDRFLTKFIEFQTMLFSKTLEGHTGPSYYHLVILLFGLLPWSGFLFLCPYRKLLKKPSELKPFALLAVFWVLMITGIMSAVQTKLPHYSSPAYVPLAFFSAYGVELYFRKKYHPGFVQKGLVLLFFMVQPVFLFALPTILDLGLSDQGFPLPQFNLPLFYVLAGVSLLATVGGFYFWLRRKFFPTFLSIIFSLLIFTQVFYAQVLPEYDRLFQKPLIRKIDTYQKNGGDILFYHTLFFSPFFYNDTKINVIGSYKFKGNPEVLTKNNRKDLYIILEKDTEQKFTENYPEIPKFEEDERFSIYKKSRNSGN